MIYLLEVGKVDVPIKDQTFEQFFEREVAIAKSIFNERGYLHLMFIGEGSDGEYFPLGVAASDDHDKEDAAEEIREYFAAKGVKRYAVMTEAWTVIRPASTKAEFVRPSREKDRAEIILVQVFDNKMNHLSATIPIIRGEGDKPPRLGDPLVTSMPASGRFAHLLNVVN